MARSSARSSARPGGDLRRWPRDRFNYDTVHTYLLPARLWVER